MEWTSGQKPHLIKHGRKIPCNTKNFVPIVVPGLLTRSSSSSTSTSSTSGPQDSMRDDSAPRPANTRRSKRRRALRDQWRDFQRNQKQKISDRQEWLEELTDTFVEEAASASSEAAASISREPLHQEPPIKAVSGKPSICTHFPKDRDSEVCKRTKITRAPCRKRNGNQVPRAEPFGDLMTAGHKILDEDSESRNNHRYPVVVQDLTTQWIQSYPCKQNLGSKQKKITKVSRADSQAKSHVSE